MQQKCHGFKVLSPSRIIISLIFNEQTILIKNIDAASVSTLASYKGGIPQQDTVPETDRVEQNQQVIKNHITGRTHKISLLCSQHQHLFCLGAHRWGAYNHGIRRLARVVRMSANSLADTNSSLSHKWLPSADASEHFNVRIVAGVFDFQFASHEAPSSQRTDLVIWHTFFNSCGFSRAILCEFVSPSVHGDSRPGDYPEVSTGMVT